VVPAFIVRVPGEKAKFTMLTTLPEAGVMVFDVEQLVAPINNTDNRIMMIVNTIYFFIFSPHIHSPLIRTIN